MEKHFGKDAYCRYYCHPDYYPQRDSRIPNYKNLNTVPIYALPTKGLLHLTTHNLQCKVGAEKWRKTTVNFFSH